LFFCSYRGSVAMKELQEMALRPFVFVELG